jgi:hypothetical protein
MARAPRSKDTHRAVGKTEMRRWQLVMFALALLTVGQMAKYTKDYDVRKHGWVPGAIAYMQRNGTFKNMPRSRKRTVYSPKSMKEAYKVLRDHQQVTSGSTLLKMSQKAGAVKRGGRSVGRFKACLTEYARVNNLPLRFGPVKGQPAQQNGDAKKRVDACKDWRAAIRQGKMDTDTLAHVDEMTKFNNPPPKSKQQMHIHSQ